MAHHQINAHDMDLPQERTHIHPQEMYLLAFSGVSFCNLEADLYLQAMVHT